MSDGQRLSKVIASRGVASRREAETMIANGRVTVNHQVATGLTFVEADDEIKVDGKMLPVEPPKVYYLMYKPRGYITGRNDPEGRKSVLDLVEDIRFRVEPVGRLDFDTEGALVLTNDGELANQLTHPSRKVPKRYLAKVYRTPSDKTLKAIETGVFLEDGRTHPAKVRVADTTDKTNSWIEVTVTEGRYRLIRRMFAQLGHPVAKLRRESFGTISLRNMERGQIRPLNKTEVARLQELARGVNPSKAGKKRGKGFAKAKPKPVRPGYKKKKR